MQRTILVFLLLPTCSWAQGQTTLPPMRVVGFENSLTLQAGEHFVQLTQGSIGFAVPAGVKTTVLSGKAYLNVAGTALSADAGDSFSYLLVEGRPQLLVVEGLVEVAAPDGRRQSVGPGQLLPLSGSGPPAARTSSPQAPPSAPSAGPPGEGFKPVEQPGPAPEPPAQAAPPKAAEPAAAREESPLTLIGDAFYRLAKVRPSEIRLVVELHPYYMLTETYDSNIYLVPKDKSDGTTVGGGVLGSWITQNTFGSKILMPFNRRHKVEALYDVNLLNYAQQPSVNNTLNQKVSARYDYNQRRGVKVGLREQYQNTEDPAFSELVGRQRRYQNTMGAKYDNERSRRFVYGLDAEITHHKYLDRTLSLLLNRYESAAGGYAGVKLAPKTKLYLDYHREAVHYSAGRANHSKSHRIGLGLSGVIAPKVTGEIGAGLQLRRYELPPAGQPRDKNNLVTDVKLAYAPGRRTKMGLRVFRSVSETTFSSNRYYVATGGALSLSHTLEKLTAGADFSFETDRYPESTTLAGISANRRDDLYTSGLALNYQFKKWLSAGLSFQRLQRHSKFPDDFNYETSRTSANLRVEF